MTNAHTDLGPAFWKDQKKGDLLRAYGPYDNRRVPGPTAANQVLRSSAALTYSWGALVDGDLPSHGASEHDNRARDLAYFRASDFTIQAGTPDLALRGTNTRYRAWALDAASSEAILSEDVMLTDYVSGAIALRWWWTNLGAGSGNVIWQISLRNVAAAGDLNATGYTSVTETALSAPTQDVLQVTTSTISFTPTASTALVNLIIARVGGDAADTLGNDAGFIGAKLEYTADS